MGVRAKSWLSALAVLAVNVLIAAPLFRVEYSAYHGSIESTFIAIARIMAKYPGQWSWWPFWNGGLPFENSYLPFTHWVTAAFSVLSGLSAARAFHIVTAGFYVLSAVAVYWMALALSRRPIASLFAALIYSSVSSSALLIPAIAADAGGALNLRRLQDLVAYGESPHMAALAMLPVALVCFSRALDRREVRWTLLAGASTACVVLSNAFSVVDIGIALTCWLMAYPSKRNGPPKRNGPRILRGLAIAIVTYAWISPWLSPTMIHAIRADSFTAGADYRYKTVTWLALVGAGGGFLLIWLLMRRFKTAPHLQFFLLLAYFPTAVVLTSYRWNVSLVPQPRRYEQEMDLALVLAVVFATAALLGRLKPGLRNALAGVCAVALAAQTSHSVDYARGLIRNVDPASLGEYRIAKWLDHNRPGQRALITSSPAFLYNVFTDNPQLLGGHEQHNVNQFLPIVSYTVYYGVNAGDRDAEYSIFWLKAFGAHLITVSGPESSNLYTSMVHPRKFDGVLPLLWRDRGDSIYEVPSRNASLAHVIPASAVVTRTPVHGLDIGPVQPYVAALEDSANPLASFQWKSLSEADIQTTLGPGQVVAVQVTYAPGWEAWANGRRQEVHGDAIGQTVIEPDCNGPCEISLRYTGGKERVITRVLSGMAFLGAIFYAWREKRRDDVSTYGETN